MGAMRKRSRIWGCTCREVGRKIGLAGGREGCRHTIRRGESESEE